MNREAVALAADSAVTMRGEKVFFSANKIFSLSKYAPVAAMIYGNYGLMGIPWEPVIKAFRADLGSTKYKTISRYAAELLKFVQSHRGFFSASLCDASCENHLFEFFRFLFGQMVDQKKTRTKAKANSQPDLKDIEFITDYFFDFWRKAKPLSGVTKKTIGRLRKKQGKFISMKLDEMFHAGPRPPQRVRKKIEDMSIMSLVKCPPEFSWPSLTGLVVSGFGESELFPALSHCSLHGIFDGNLHYRIEGEDQIGVSGDSLIFPFAQPQMIFSFMEGVDPGYQQVVEEETTALINQYPRAVIERCGFLSDKDKQRIVSAFSGVQDKIRGGFLGALATFRKQKFVDETLGLIAVVPKIELATLAESLINLTSLRRKISLDSETVGGPVDVALISKGDGLIWIKRKHYFDPSLNRHFFHNAYNGKE
jgi:hypothetical protein